MMQLNLFYDIKPPCLILGSHKDLLHAWPGGLTPTSYLTSLWPEGLWVTSSAGPAVWAKGLSM